MQLLKAGESGGAYKGTSSLSELGNHHILKNSDQEKTAFQKELGDFLRGFCRYFCAFADAVMRTSGLQEETSTLKHELPTTPPSHRPKPHV